MSRRITSTSYKWISFSLTLILFISAVPTSAFQSQVEPNFRIDPGSIQIGKTRDVVITTDIGIDLTEFTLEVPPTDTGISFESKPQITGNNQSITVRVKVDQEADPETVPLKLVKKNGEVEIVNLTITEFRPRPLQRQPVPEGIKQEEAVDYLMMPMSYKTTKDNYGRRVADAYYAVFITLGNNTGFDLQIVNVGFDTTIQTQQRDPQGNLVFDNSNKPVMERLQVGAFDRTLVRGSIEREQQYGKRALALNMITGIGTFATGFLPFFHSLTPRANFASFSSLFNGQLKEGFGLAFPDLTIRQLNRLENNNVLHEEMTLVNNQSDKIVVFVPRQALNIEKKDRDNLPLVRERLGNLILVGRPITRYNNREIVVRTGATNAFGNQGAGNQTPGSAASSATKPAPVVTGISPKAGLVTETKEITITGANFASGATVTFGGADAAVKSVTPTSLIAVTPAHLPAEVEVKVTNPDGQSATASDKYRYFTELLVSGSDRSSGSTAGGDSMKIFGQGFIQGAKVLFDGIEAPADSITISGDGTLITLKTPPHGEGMVHVVVINPSSYPIPGGKELAGGFTYNP